MVELEKKLEKALQGGLAAAGGGGAQASSQATSARSSRSVSPRVSSAAKIPSGMDRYVAQKDGSDTSMVQSKWHQVLQAVKDEKVTIHAWFIV